MIESSGSESLRPALDFDMRVADDRGLLVLENHTLFGALALDFLELEIPNLTFPFELDGRVERFQKQRCRLSAAKITATETSLAKWLRSRAPGLAAAGFSDVRVEILEGWIDISGRARVADTSADFSGRLRVSPAGKVISVRGSSVRLFGRLARPAPLLLHDLLLALIPTANVRDLLDVHVDPLTPILFHAMPPLGWRVPDSRGTAVEKLTVEPGRLCATFGPGPGTETDAPDPSPAHERLLAADFDGALAAFRKALEIENPAGWEDYLSLLASRPETRPEALLAATDVLARHPSLVGAELVLATLLDPENVQSSAEHYARAAELARNEGHHADAERATLLAARRFQATDPARAALLYESTLERDPGHREAGEARFQAHFASQSWPELVALCHKRIAHLDDPHEQAREHLRLGELYLTWLGDPARAREELILATRKNDRDLRAHELLARALSELGDVNATIRAWDHFAQLCESRGDTELEAKTHVRIGRAWQAQGDLGHAHARYRRALEIIPDDAEALELLSRTALARGRTNEAIATLTRLAGLAHAHPDTRLSARRELALVLLRNGDHVGARANLEQAATTSHVDPRTLAMLAELDEAEGKFAAAEAAYERAMAPLPPGPEAAGLAARRAAILLRQERRGEARQVWEIVHRFDPKGQGIAAMTALAQMAREDGDASTEARWLDALLVEIPDQDRAIRLQRRAELHLTAGEPGLARILLEQALAITGDRRAVRKLLTVVLDTLAEPLARAEVLDALATDTEEPGERAHLLVQAATARLDADDPEAALACARLACALAPHDAAARSVMGEAAWRSHSFDDVVAAYHALPPGQAAVVETERAFRLGTSLESCGRDADAMVAYRAFLSAPDARGEDLATAYARLASLCERTSDQRRAAETLALATEDPRTEAAKPTRVAWHARAAALFRQLADRPRAVSHLEAALDMEPEHLDSLAALEELYRQAGDSEHVAGVLARRIKATKHPEQQKLLLGKLAELQVSAFGRADVAANVYRRILEIDRNFRPALRFLGALAEEQSDFAAARATYEAIVAAAKSPLDDEAQVSEDQFGAHLGLARLARLEGRTNDHQRHLASAQAIGPEPEKFMGELLGELTEVATSQERWNDVVALLAKRASKTKEPSSRIELEERRVRILLEKAHEPTLALVSCRALVAQAPTEPRLLLLLADCAQAAKRPAERADALSRLTALGISVAPPPVDPGVALARAKQLLQENDPAGALDLLRPLATNECSSELLQLRADLFADASEWNQVAPDLDEILRRSKKDSDRALELQATRKRAALTLDRLRDEPAALALYERALELDPDDLASADAVAQCYERRRSPSAEKALERLQDVTRRTCAGPAKEIEVLNRLGNEALGRGDLTRARRVLADALALAPRDPWVARFAADVSEREGPSTEIAPEKRSQALLGLLRTQLAELRDESRTVSDLEIVTLSDLRQEAAASGTYRDLADGLALMAEHAAEAAVFLVELATVRRERLHDNAGATQALERAMQECPEDPTLLYRLDPILREQGEHERLLELYEQALRTAPHSVRGRLLSAAGHLWAEAMGEPMRAAGYFMEALRIDPGLTDLLMPLSDHFAFEGDHANAETFTIRALAAHAVPKDHVASMMARAGELAMERSDASEAAQRFGEAARREPSNHAARWGLELIARSEGKWQTVAERLIARARDDASPRDRAAVLCEAAYLLDEKVGDERAAMAVYDELLTQDPHDEWAASRRKPDATPAASRLSTDRTPDLAPANDSPAPIDLQLASGAACEERGDLERAVFAYEQANALDPHDPRPLEALVRVGQARNDPAFLVDILDRQLAATADSPGRARICLLRGLLYRDRLEQEGEAYRCLKEAFAHDPSLVPALFALRQLAETHGDWRLAAEVSHRLVAEAEDAPTRARLSMELGDLYLERLHDVETALRNYESALADDPKSLAAAALVHLYLERDLFGEAAAAEEIAAGAEPNGIAQAEGLLRAAAHFERAGNQYDANRLRETVSLALKARIAESPDDVVALDLLARVAKLRGDITTAISTLVQRLELAPDGDDRIGEMNQALGELWQAAGDVGAARTRFEMVLALAPDHVPALSRLLELETLVGEWTRATETIQRLLALVTDPGKRADLCYRAGEIYRLQLADEERAAEAYMAARELDPRHLPSLLRLVDKYWADDDLLAIADVASQLEVSGDLASDRTPAEVWARVAVVAVMQGDHGRARAMAEALGESRSGLLAATIAEAAARKRATQEALVHVAITLCAPPGPSLGIVKAVLDARGNQEPTAKAIAERL